MKKQRIRFLALFLLLCFLPAQADALRITVTALDRPAQPEPAHEAVLALARIIYWEARGEPDEGKLAVGQVVLNRVRSDLYPDTIEEVIAQSGQFSPWGCENYFEAELTQACIDAAEDALSGLGTLPGDVLWFRADCAPETWGIAVRYTTIGAHHFYRMKQAN